MIATVLALGAVAGAPSPATASAIVPDAGAGSDTRVVVGYRDGVETLDIALAAGPGEGRIGLVIPTPSAAETTMTDGALLASLDATIEPRRVVEDDWWGRGPAPVAEDASAAIPSTPLAEAEQRSIRGTDKAGLNRWLADNGLDMGDATRAAVTAYAKRGWALSLLAFAAPSSETELQPVRLSFPSDEPVFPLALWSTAATPLTLRFYVIGEGRTELREDTAAGRPIDAAQSTVWTGSLRGTDVEALGDYLTVTDVRVHSPADQLTDDVRIMPAAADDESIPTVTVYHPVQLFGIPLGWLLSAWVAVGIVLLLGWTSYRLRRR
jgi:hypothetical protein